MSNPETETETGTAADAEVETTAQTELGNSPEDPAAQANATAHEQGDPEVDLADDHNAYVHRRHGRGPPPCQEPGCNAPAVSVTGYSKCKGHADGFTAAGASSR